MKTKTNKWQFFLAGAILLFVSIFFLIKGQNVVVATDSLDSGIMQYRMLKNEHLFFAHEEYASFLGGIARNFLPSEFKLYTALYLVFPTFFAYLFGKLLTVLLSVFGAVLLAKELLGSKERQLAPFVVFAGLAYGFIAFLPQASFSYASLPLLAFLLCRVSERPKIRYFIPLLFYPVLSDFTSFGIPILCVILLAFVCRWILKKKFPYPLLLSFFLLLAGYIGTEYRLFYETFFEDNTYAAVMRAENLPESAPLLSGLALVCVLAFFAFNITYVIKKEPKKILHDPLNGLVLFAVLCRVVYVLCDTDAVRHFLTEVLPPVLDLDSSFVLFANPFCWCAAFFLIVKRLSEHSVRDSFDTETGLPNEKGKAGRRFASFAANALALAAALLMLFSDSSYNDFFHTLFHTGGETYRAYYSEALLAKAKEELSYDGEWAAAYGLSPAVLSYNGIKTIDGDFDVYSLNYKDYFRRVIEPALSENEAAAEQFDENGAQCRLYGTDGQLAANLNAFKYLGGRYIFSDGEITNAADLGLDLAGTYTDSASPYALYVYITHSRYQDKYHSETPFEEREIELYDLETLHRAEEEIKALTDESNAYAKAQGLDVENEQDLEVLAKALDGERALALYEDVMTELSNLRTSYTMAQLRYYQDVTNEDMNDRMSEIYEVLLDEGDAAQASIRELCLSPYRAVMNRKLGRSLVHALSEYEDMTDEEKERSLKIQGLEQEYDQAYLEDYYFEYKGELWDYDMLNDRAYELSQDELVEIYQGIGRERAGALGEIYLELLALYHTEAEEEDYDNYADYAYENVYVRDYTVDEIETLLNELSKRGMTYIGRIDGLSEHIDTDFGYLTEDGTKTWETLLPCMEDIDPELGVSMRHLIDCGTYDMDASDTKPDMGFTTGLDSYGDAFIFNSPYEVTGDLFTFVHEFGHYSNAYYQNESLFESFDNLDVAEIHSQGLEMLFTAYYKSIYGEETGKGLLFSEVYNMVDGLPSSAMVTEFELYAHRNPDSTVEELSREYLNIQEKYGYQYMDGIDAIYTWVEVPHIFNSPCYYVSYLTSALTSLEIYTLSYEDWDDAVEKYMEITAYPSIVPYSAVVEEVGLSNIFEKGTVRDILKNTYQILKDEVDD